MSVLLLLLSSCTTSLFRETAARSSGALQPTAVNSDDVHRNPDAGQSSQLGNVVSAWYYGNHARMPRLD